MEDVFYFTKEAVSLDDIACMAKETNYRYETIQASGVDTGQLRIYYGGQVESWQRSDPSEALEVHMREDYWYWEKWDDWLDTTPEPEHKAKLLEYSPTSAFIISYRPGSLPILKRFLKLVLRRFGGWVGDAEDWSNPYTLSNIDKLEYLLFDLRSEES